MPRIRSVPLVAVQALVLGGLLGCSSANSPSAPAQANRLRVAVAFYPIEEIVRSVGGVDVDVIDLTPPGSEPHDLELTAQTASELQDASMVFFLGRGFQPGVEKALESLPDAARRVDLLEGISLLPVTDQLAGTQGEVEGETIDGDRDPHVWVDPVQMIAMTMIVTETLSKADPTNAQAFGVRAQAYVTTLSELDKAFATRLANCESRTIVTSHRAFAYLTDRYELQQIPIAGISPEEEPDPKSMQAVAAAAKEFDVTTVFFEDRVPKDLSETIAAEIGAQTAALDPIETITSDDLADGVTYASIQRSNLETLTAALRCGP